MYYQNYEDYMRTILGYPVENANTYQQEYRTDYYDRPMYTPMTDTFNMSEVEEMYPEIYKKINPMVCHMCQNNNNPVTRELVENMTEEIYSKIEMTDGNIINIKVETRANDPKENRDTKPTNATTNAKENRTEESRRRPNNPILRDLIRILILNQLLGGNFPGNRPPRPPRPPFPGPGNPGGPIRPPMPRNYDSYLKF